MLKITILGNEDKNENVLWIKSLEKHRERIEYDVIDLTKSDWFKKIEHCKSDLYLTKPPGLNSISKQLYDERIWIINKILKFPIYPSFEEVLVYENKRLLSCFLAGNNISCPKTSVFYFKDEALEFLNNCQYPIVGKFSIGASGYGIKIINTQKRAEDYIKTAFSSKGLTRKWGPNFNYGNWGKRIGRYLKGERKLSDKIKTYSLQKAETQKGFVILQEFIPHDFEWRCVRIGDSYFAHKKMKKGDKTSGTLMKNYDNPPLYLFDFVKELTERIDFKSVAIDLFEYPERNFLINEIQCFFGQSDPYQMKVDDKPGRYIISEKKWIFEEGYFCTNECFDLRLDHALSLIK
ncbi:MAG: hypothetical protein JXA99_17140 [Candidatus Lokiarchaeota archaeon]|nr:hypothetical protein [Candidatus Lokiarchaeota archaeon]